MMDKLSLIVEKLNNILQLELAGVIRYTHYSFMVFGFTRIPIVNWLRGQADESLAHAQRAGELITHLGGKPHLGIGPLLDRHSESIEEILRESVEHERKALEEYKALLKEVEGQTEHIFLEEYARELIMAEEDHLAETLKMLRKPAED